MEPDYIAVDTSIGKEIIREQNLNDLFQQLSQEDIHIRSMRNKANRLEQLFVHLTDHNNNRERVA